ncbi:hypothetical protein Tco_0435290, partial [Tanacetum coccineum]
MLSRETLPDIRDAFAIISREESHRGIASLSSGSISKPQVSGFVSKTNNWANNGNKNVDNKKYGNTVNTCNNRGPNPNLICKNCGNVRHTIDRCFDLIGYPPGYNKNLGPKQNGFKSFNANFVSTSNENGTPLSFTNEQMMKLINLINEVPSENMQANMAGNQTTTCYVSKSSWHNRLGYPSDQAVDVLHFELNFTKDSYISPCDICHKAKQTIEPFPLSDHQTTSIGELVHKHYDNQTSVSPNDDGRGNYAPNDKGNDYPCTKNTQTSNGSEDNIATSMCENIPSEGTVPSTFGLNAQDLPENESQVKLV